MKQMSFSDLAYRTKKKQTRRERFLKEMDAVLPWEILLKPIERKYPKPGNGRRPIGAAVMLRIYFMQQWYGLSDPGMEDSLYDVESMRRFAGVNINGVPDETTICKFRHFLEHHGLTEALFRQTKRYLTRRGMIVNEGTIVDATIIHAPSSTKNKDRKRDPEMASTKKGNTWHFGMKAHVGADVKGRVHSVVTTPASVHDSQAMDACLHGKEKDHLRRQGLCGSDAKRTSRSQRRGMASASQGPPGQASQLRGCFVQQKEQSHTRTGRTSLWGSSNTCGAIGRSGIAVWRRTPPICSPCLPWPTSIWHGRNWRLHSHPCVQIGRWRPIWPAASASGAAITPRNPQDDDPFNINSLRNHPQKTTCSNHLVDQRFLDFRLVGVRFWFKLTDVGRLLIAIPRCILSGDGTHDILTLIRHYSGTLIRICASE